MREGEQEGPHQSLDSTSSTAQACLRRLSSGLHSPAQPPEEDRDAETQVILSLADLGMSFVGGQDGAGNPHYQNSRSLSEGTSPPSPQRRAEKLLHCLTKHLYQDTGPWRSVEML